MADTKPSEAAIQAAQEFLYDESDRGWLASELEHKQLNAATVRVAQMLHAFAADAVKEERERLLEHELPCDHCGDIAFVSFRPGGVFVDGEGGYCMSCGIAGHVSADEDRCDWTTDPSGDGVCERKDCDECRGGA